MSNEAFQLWALTIPPNDEAALSTQATSISVMH